MAVKTKGWSAERRARQAEICRALKPSRHATGPKTVDGKAASSRNALKHGFYSETAELLLSLLRAQRTHLKSLGKSIN